MASTNRRVADKLQVGDLVYKGNGKVQYRVWALAGAGQSASVVKSTTEKDPTRGCFYPISDFTFAES